MTNVTDLHQVLIPRVDSDKEESSEHWTSTHT